MPRTTLNDIKEKRVAYECTFRNSKAAHARFSLALFKYEAYKLDSLWFKSDYHDLNCLVKIQPSKTADFVKDVKPIYWKYQSPDLFDGRGTLHAVYASPEDEVAGIEQPKIARIREILTQE